MKTICYHANGIAIPDCEAEKLALKFLINSEETGISVSTENFIVAVRCLVAEGIYPHDQLVFMFNNEVITLTKSGNCSDWPPGFCDITIRLVERVVKARPRLKKNEEK